MGLFFHIHRALWLAVLLAPQQPGVVADRSWVELEPRSDTSSVSRSASSNSTELDDEVGDTEDESTESLSNRSTAEDDQRLASFDASARGQLLRVNDTDKASSSRFNVTRASSQESNSTAPSPGDYDDGLDESTFSGTTGNGAAFTDPSVHGNENDFDHPRHLSSSEFNDRGVGNGHVTAESGNGAVFTNPRGDVSGDQNNSTELDLSDDGTTDGNLNPIYNETNDKSLPCSPPHPLKGLCEVAKPGECGPSMEGKGQKTNCVFKTTSWGDQKCMPSQLGLNEIRESDWYCFQDESGTYGGPLEGSDLPYACTPMFGYAPDGGQIIVVTAEREDQGDLGLIFFDSPHSSRKFIDMISPGSWANTKGLNTGDEILEIDGQKMPVDLRVLKKRPLKFKILRAAMWEADDEAKIIGLEGNESLNYHTCTLTSRNGGVCAAWRVVLDDGTVPPYPIPIPNLVPPDTTELRKTYGLGDAGTPCNLQRMRALLREVTLMNEVTFNLFTMYDQTDTGIVTDKRKNPWTSPSGALKVSEVLPRSWAARQGIQKGDEIVRINFQGVTVLRQADFDDMWSRRPLSIVLKQAGERDTDNFNQFQEEEDQLERLKTVGIEPGELGTPVLQDPKKTRASFTFGKYKNEVEQTQLQSLPFRTYPGSDANMQTLRRNVEKFVREAYRVKNDQSDEDRPPDMSGWTFQQLRDILEQQRSVVQQIKKDDDLNGAKLTKYFTNDRRLRHRRYKRAVAWLNQYPTVSGWINEEEVAREVIDKMSAILDQKIEEEVIRNGGNGDGGKNSAQSEVADLRLNGIVPGTHGIELTSDARHKRNGMPLGRYKEQFKDQQMVSKAFKNPGAESNMRVLRENIQKFTREAYRIKDFHKDTERPPDMSTWNYDQLEEIVQKEHGEIQQIAKDDDLRWKSLTKRFSDSRRARERRKKQADAWLSQSSDVMSWVDVERKATKIIEDMEEKAKQPEAVKVEVENLDKLVDVQNLLAAERVALSGREKTSDEIDEHEEALRRQYNLGPPGDSGNMAILEQIEGLLQAGNVVVLVDATDLGMRYNTDGESSYVSVTNVVPEGWAAKKGLTAHARITNIAGRPAAMMTQGEIEAMLATCSGANPCLMAYYIPEVNAHRMASDDTLMQENARMIAKKASQIQVYRNVKRLINDEEAYFRDKGEDAKPPDCDGEETSLGHLQKPPEPTDLNISMTHGPHGRIGLHDTAVHDDDMTPSRLADGGFGVVSHPENDNQFTAIDNGKKPKPSKFHQPPKPIVEIAYPGTAGDEDGFRLNYSGLKECGEHIRKVVDNVEKDFDDVGRNHHDTVSHLKNMHHYSIFLKAGLQNLRHEKDTLKLHLKHNEQKKIVDIKQMLGSGKLSARAKANAAARAQIRREIAKAQALPAAVHNYKEHDAMWWHEMPFDARRNWGVLGWHETNWDRDKILPATTFKHWVELAGVEKGAAAKLGYTPESWNEQVTKRKEENQRRHPMDLPRDVDEVNMDGSEKFPAPVSTNVIEEDPDLSDSDERD